MSLSEKNKLFDKFMSGSISKDEMHLLNQYALDDDFLFDAIEGASLHDNEKSRSMLQLQQRLAEKQTKRKRPLWLWLSAAASAAAIVIAIVTINPLQESAMADVITTESVEEVSAEGASEMESEASEIVLAEQKRKDLPSPPAAAREQAPRTSEPKIVLKTPSETDETKPEQEVALTEPLAKEEMEAVADDEARIETIPSLGTVRSELESQAVTEEVLADVEESQKVSNVVVSNAPTRDKKRKRAAAQTTPNEFLTSTNKAFERPKTNFADVKIDDDPVNALALEQFLLGFDTSQHHNGTLEFTMILEDGVLVEPLKITKSINPDFDQKFRSYVESFTGWTGSGNKKVSIRFSNK